jgi:hypothetical protein
MVSCESRTNDVSEPYAARQPRCGHPWYVCIHCIIVLNKSCSSDKNQQVLTYLG